MKKKLSNIRLSSLLLKVSSLVMGYVIWSFLANHNVIEQTIEIPLCFYNTSDSMRLESSVSQVTVQLSGKPKDLAWCNNLACHVNAHELKEGENYLHLTQKELLLPSRVKLIHYTPLTLCVEKKINRNDLLTENRE